MEKSNLTLRHIAVTAAICLIPFGVQAQVQMEDVGQVREKLARLETQVEMMQKEFNLEQLRQAQDAWRKQVEQAATGALPTVTAIFHYDNKWQTRLMFDTGVTRLLSVGDVLSPGVRVADIAHTGVTISKVIPEKERVARKGGRQPVEEEVKLILLKPTPTSAAGFQAAQSSAAPGLGTALPNPVPLGR